MLDTRDAQALHARAVDRALPRGELLQRQAVAFQHFVDGQQAAIDCGDDLRLAANDPALGLGAGNSNKKKDTSTIQAEEEEFPEVY